MTIEAALDCLRRGDPQRALALLTAPPPGHAAQAETDAALGMVLLAEQRPAEARIMLRSAVTLGDTRPATLLNLALAEMAGGDPERGRVLMTELQLRLPGWDEPILRLAESQRDAGGVLDAEQSYRRVLEVNPRRVEALIALAVLLLGRNDAAAAQGLLLRACGIAPRNAEAWDALGLALRLGDDGALAVSAHAEAQRLQPGNLDYALHLVDAAWLSGSGEAELARLCLLSHTDPTNVPFLVARGVLAERLGHRGEAIDALETAVALAPDAAIPVRLLGTVLARSNRLQDAEAALRRASVLDPDSAQLQNDHAAVLMRLHRHAEAEAELTELLATHGDQLGAICNLANATLCCGRQDAAVTLAHRAIALAPDASLPRRTLVNVLPYRQGITGEELLGALRECSDRLPRSPAPIFDNQADPDRRLVIGLLSGSLRTHPVGWLTIAGFETLDRSAFHLVCLAQSTAQDSIAQRFRAVARVWQEIDRLDDPALAIRARELGIDVLIDLGGYGDAGRMSACAYRLAPVQVKWVGMQNHSTGLAEMDWLITDRWETPPELERCYTERLLRLPDGYICYSPPPYAPDPVALPALRNGRITFGCFNNLAKITPQVIATWCDILRQVPDARLVLKTHQFSDAATAERIRAAFTYHCIDPARIALRGASHHRAFLGEYNDIDLVLDPFPYCGGLTTCEALWMGVPTVTLAGETFASRHSASHLSNAGLTDWIARDLTQYREMAIAKAMDVPALASLRAGLRGQIKASPLCDAQRFGRNLGGALRHAWRDWCARR